MFSDQAGIGGGIIYKRTWKEDLRGGTELSDALDKMVSRTFGKVSKIIKQRPAHPANRIRTRWDFSGIGRSKIAALPVPNSTKLDFTTSKFLSPSNLFHKICCFLEQFGIMRISGPRSRNTTTRCSNISGIFLKQHRVSKRIQRSERWKVKKFPFVQRQ